MSYKSIDLQTSLPRAAEMTPIVQHQQQRSAAEQGMLAQQTVKSAEHNAQRKTQAESASGRGISDREPGSRGRRPPSKLKAGTGKAEPEENKPSAGHPYKGQHIDFMG